MDTSSAIRGKKRKRAAEAAQAAERENVQDGREKSTLKKAKTDTLCELYQKAIRLKEIHACERCYRPANVYEDIFAHDEDLFIRQICDDDNDNAGEGTYIIECVHRDAHNHHIKAGRWASFAEICGVCAMRCREPDQPLQLYACSTCTSWSHSCAHMGAYNDSRACAASAEDGLKYEYITNIYCERNSIGDEWMCSSCVEMATCEKCKMIWAAEGGGRGCEAEWAPCKACDEEAYDDYLTHC